MNDALLDQFVTMTSETSPLLQALSAHQVRASVVDLDHNRVHGGISVETDYIISVHPDEMDGDSFESFKYVHDLRRFRFDHYAALL